MDLDPQSSSRRPTLSSRIRATRTALQPDKRTLPRLWRYNKAYSGDHWFDMVSTLLITGVAGIVRCFRLCAATFPSMLTSLFEKLLLIPTRPPLLFPLLTPNGAVYNPYIAYPYVRCLFNSLSAGLLGGLIPLGVILLSQLFVRSFADFSAAFLGLQYALATGTLFQLILKKSIGGLRPHFLAVCKPRPISRGSGVGYEGIMYSVKNVCTGTRKDIEWGIQSFPSGHSEIAFAGLGYLAIYLFTHLHIGDRSRTRKAGFWRMVLVLTPILLATYISSTLVQCYHHHV